MSVKCTLFPFNVAIAKTSFLHPSILPPCTAVPGCTILTSPSQLSGKGSLLSFSFTSQHTLQMLPHTSLQLPLHGKLSTEHQEKADVNAEGTAKA